MGKRNHLKVIICLLLLFTANISGCSYNDESNEDKLIVAVSIVPQETFVKAVAGDLVEVVTMIPPGYSPENYNPTPQEMEKFSRSRLYFSIGVPVEEANILPRAKDINNNISIINLAEETVVFYPERELAPGQRDPHIWLSPKRVKVMIEVICRELSAVDQKNKEVYQKNAFEYIDKLDRLDQKIKNSLKNLKSRTFIINHPSFGYFSDDYGLNMIALEKDGKEATARELQEAVEMARQENIKVIFCQEEIDSKQSRALAEEIGGRTELIAPLAPDYIRNLEDLVEILISLME